METILPILVAIVIFAFQAYANFQKEQEKARKRNPGQPRVPDSDAQPFDEYPTMEEPPIPDYWQEPIPQAPQRDVAPQAQKKKSAVQQAFNEYSGVMDVDEVRRVRKSRQRQIIPQRLDVDDDEIDSNAIGDGQPFDLRDAVIKSAILERPYQ